MYDEKLIKKLAKEKSFYCLCKLFIDHTGISADSAKRIIDSCYKYDRDNNRIGFNIDSLLTVFRNYYKKGKPESSIQPEPKRDISKKIGNKIYDENKIKELAEEKQIFSLSDRLRSLSGVTEATSMALLNKCKIYNKQIPRSYTFDINKILDIFRKYSVYCPMRTIENKKPETNCFFPIVEPDTSQPKPQDKIKDDLIKGIENIFNNWEILGYSTPFEGISAIVDNYENKWNSERKV